MASKREFSRVGEWVKEVDSLSELQPVRVDAEYPSVVRLRLRLGANVNYIATGKETGQTYRFTGNTPIDVIESDSVELLTRIVGKNPCCGASGVQPVFEIVEESD